MMLIIIDLFIAMSRHVIFSVRFATERGKHED